MASSFTGLGTELMTTGENAGTWGTTTNTNLQIIEQISGGYTEQDIAGSADTTTLSVSDGSTGAVLGHRVIKFTGTITGNQIVTIPLDVQQMYIVVNGTSGAYTVQFKYASGSGSSVTFAATDKGTKLLYATADHATNPNLVDSGIGSTAGHDLDGNELILDADADTSITADTDDQIDIKIAGADDFQFTANTFTAQSGSTIAAQALTATTVTASGIIKTDSTTAATSTTDGSLQTDGGLSVAADAIIGDDLKLLSDSAVLSFGADSDTTLTHTDGTGLTLNSTNKLLFGDTGTYIHQSADGVLDLVSDTEIEINATTIDINGAIAMDGAITGATNITLSGELDSATLDVSGNADIDGTTNLDAVDIDGAVQIDGATTVGVDGTGLDVKFFGDTSGSFLLWDQSDDALELTDSSPIKIGDAGDMQIYHDGSNSYITNSQGALKVATETSGIAITIGHTTSEVTVADNLTVTGTLTLGSNAELTEAELEFLDGITAGTAAASKAMVADGNIDISGGRNITISGELDAATLDISGNADIDGTTNLDAVDIDGAVQLDATLTVGADDQGYDIKFFGDTASAFMLWDTSTDDLILGGAAKLYLYDAAGGENISSDGTDLTIASGAALNLTATTDVVIPANVGITFGSGEKIEGDSTDLTVTSGGAINLTATSDVVIPANVGITFGTGEKIEGDSTDLTVTSGGAINLTATTDVVIPNSVGIQFGGASEKIEGDGTDLVISANNLTVDAAADIILDAAGNNVIFKSGGTAILDISNSSSDAVITSSVQDKDIIFKGDDGGSAVTALTLDMSAGGIATFSAAANVAQQALTSSSNAVAWDASDKPNAYHLTTENTTFSEPSNAVEGAFICLELNFDGSHTIGWNTIFEFAASTEPTETATNAKTDIHIFRYNGSVWQEVGRTLNLSES